MVISVSHSVVPDSLEWVAISFFPGDLPNPGIEPGSPVQWADSLPTELQGKLQGGGNGRS